MKVMPFYINQQSNKNNSKYFQKIYSNNFSQSNLAQNQYGYGHKTPYLKQNIDCFTHCEKNNAGNQVCYHSIPIATNNNKINFGSSFTTAEKFAQNINQYLIKLNKTFVDAKDYIENCGKKCFVIFDIDGTVLAERQSHYQFISDFIDDATKANQIEAEMIKTHDKARENNYFPAIKKSKEFINWLDEKGIPYCFATGRTKNHTELVRGMNWDALIPYNFLTAQTSPDDKMIINLLEEGLIGQNCKGVYFYQQHNNVEVNDYKQILFKDLAKQNQGTQQVFIGNSDKDFPDFDFTRKNCFLVTAR